MIFGDLNAADGQSLASSFNSEHVHFVPCDVRNYSDQVALFKLALSKYGRVDHAIANAGIVEQGNWFNPEQSLEDVEREPDTSVLDVNLRGATYFARIPAVYVGRDMVASEDKSLILLSSAAGFVDSRGLPLYQASKHGVLGLLRTLRLYLPEAFNGLRVNALCPSLTRTRIVADIEEKWMQAGLPVNRAEDVADVAVAVASADSSCALGMLERHLPRETGGVENLKNIGAIVWGECEAETGLNGRALYVEGSKAWDIEDGLDTTGTVWLGDGPTQRLQEIQAYLKGVSIRKREIAPAGS